MGGNVNRKKLKYLIFLLIISIGFVLPTFYNVSYSKFHASIDGNLVMYVVDEEAVSLLIMDDIDSDEDSILSDFSDRVNTDIADHYDIDIPEASTNEDVISDEADSEDEKNDSQKKIYVEEEVTQQSAYVEDVTEENTAEEILKEDTKEENTTEETTEENTENTNSPSLNDIMNADADHKYYAETVSVVEGQEVKKEYAEIVKVRNENYTDYIVHEMPENSNEKYYSIKDNPYKDLLREERSKIPVDVSGYDEYMQSIATYYIESGYNVEDVRYNAELDNKGLGYNIYGSTPDGGYEVVQRLFTNGFNADDASEDHDQTMFTSVVKMKPEEFEEYKTTISAEEWNVSEDGKTYTSQSVRETEVVNRSYNADVEIYQLEAVLINGDDSQYKK